MSETWFPKLFLQKPGIEMWLYQQKQCQLTGLEKRRWNKGRKILSVSYWISWILQERSVELFSCKHTLSFKKREKWQWRWSEIIRASTYPISALSLPAIWARTTQRAMGLRMLHEPKGLLHDSAIPEGLQSKASNQKRINLKPWDLMEFALLSFNLLRTHHSFFWLLFFGIQMYILCPPTTAF